MNYTSLLSTAIRLYQEGKYIETYQFITDHKDDVKGFDANLYNLRFCTASRSGQTELAINIMKEAILDKGLWYSYDYLYQDEDLEAIRDKMDFTMMAKVCKGRELDAKAASAPDLMVIKPEHFDRQKKYPLMLILHGNGQNIPIAKESWISCVKSNYILALAQSSQITFSDTYVWNDYRKGNKEIKEHYSRLLSEYSIDEENIIIGGFSAGTRTALYSILNESVNVRGFILNGCWIPELSDWEPMFDKLKSKQMKGYILCGEMDEESLKTSKKLVEMLKKSNIECIFHVVRNMGHEYPEDFEKYIEEAIHFINS